MVNRKKERPVAKTPNKREKAADGPGLAPDPEAKNPDALTIERRPGESKAQTMAEISMSPIVRNAALGRTFADSFFGDFKDGKRSDLDACVATTRSNCLQVREGDLSSVTDMLTAQMGALDALFTSMVARAGKNMGKHPDAVDRYMGLALKAQTGCRTTAETLARIKRGGKQTVKVVHVHEGGQAVVADTVNNQTNHGVGVSGGVNAGNTKQSHEQAANAVIAALPGPDTARDGMPLPSFEGEEAVPIARGSGRGS